MVRKSYQGLLKLCTAVIESGNESTFWSELAVTQHLVSRPRCPAPLCPGA